MKRLLFCLSFAVSAVTQAQPDINGGPVNVPSEGVIDGVYIKEHIPTKRLIPYEYVREADVTWSKRVWRNIDMREKINHPMYLPFDSYDASNHWVRNASRWSLFTIMKHHMMLGDLKMYSPYNVNDFNILDGDQFKYPIIPQPGLNFFTDTAFAKIAFQYIGKLGAQSTTPIANSFGEDSVIFLADGTTEYIYPARDTSWIVSKDIVQYRIKEDWFFDKERSVLDVRILGIAPVIYEKDDKDQVSGMREIFWMYFPQCRFVFNNYFVYNEQNDAQWMSFDDLFWKRQFNSTIYQESNVFDRKVESYRTGVDALMESEKITEQIRTFEHDVWNF